MIKTAEVDGDFAAHYGICDHKGWIGPFTEQQALGAYPNGTRICKIKEDPTGDMNKVGSLGRVLGSIKNPVDGQIGYFVEWEARPRMATFVVAEKISESV